MQTVKRLARAAVPVLGNRAVVAALVSAVAAVAGYALAPDQVSAVADLVTALVGLVGTP